MNQMDITIDDIAERLARPFPEDAIEWRIGQAGMLQDKSIWAKVLAYVTNRAIMDRLDQVMGIGNWQNEFREIHGGTLCGISLLLEGTWVTKWDGAEFPKEENNRTKIDPVKTMLSNAEKRAGVPWGIGRYLYRMPVSWAMTKKERDKKWNYAVLKTSEGDHKYYWKAPALPDNFLPERNK